MANLLALTPNFTVDILLSVASLIPGEVHRTTAGKRVPGGKGVNVARAIRQLGHETEIGGFLGGINGDLARQHFESENLQGHYISCPGETRYSILIDESDGRTTVINGQGMVIDTSHVDELTQMAHREAKRFMWVSFSGSVPLGAPAEAYAEIAQAAALAKLAVDTSGDVLAVLARQRPDLLKINDDEASKLVGRNIISIEEAQSACIELHSWGISNVAISMGTQGAVGFDGEVCWHAKTPSVQVVSTVGAGDAMLAGILASLMSGQVFDVALRQGVAAGAACCTVRGTGYLPMDIFEQLLKTATVSRLS